jgi:hypothetical protein
VYVRRDDPAMQSLARFHDVHGFVENEALLVQEGILTMQEHLDPAYRVERGAAAAFCHSTTL